MNEWINEWMSVWMNEWISEVKSTTSRFAVFFTSFFGVTFVPSASISKRGWSTFRAVSARKVSSSNPSHITSVNVTSPFTAIIAMIVTMTRIPVFCPRIPPHSPYTRNIFGWRMVRDILQRYVTPTKSVMPLGGLGGRHLPLQLQAEIPVTLDSSETNATNDINQLTY